jgi:hypothetical protein
MKKMISSIKQKITPNPNPIKNQYKQEGVNIIINDRPCFKKLKIIGWTYFVINGLLLLTPPIINYNLVGLVGICNIFISVTVILIFIEILGKTKLNAEMEKHYETN